MLALTESRVPGPDSESHAPCRPATAPPALGVPDVSESPAAPCCRADDFERRLARLQPDAAARRRPCGCGPYDPYTARADEWRACGCVISHLYLG